MQLRRGSGFGISQKLNLMIPRNVFYKFLDALLLLVFHWRFRLTHIILTLQAMLRFILKLGTYISMSPCFKLLFVELLQVTKNLCPSDASVSDFSQSVNGSLAALCFALWWSLSICPWSCLPRTCYSIARHCFPLFPIAPSLTSHLYQQQISSHIKPLLHNLTRPLFPISSLFKALTSLPKAFEAL